MKKYQIAQEYFKMLIKKDYKNGSLQVVKQYFDDNIGMGEMYLNLIKIRNDWYVANTDEMELISVEEFAEQLLNVIENVDDSTIEWLERYYDEHAINKEVINYV